MEGFAVNSEGHPVLAIRDFTRAVRVGGEDRLLFRDLSFDLSGGSALGLLGPRGAGKTSIIRGILRLDPVSMGSVLRHPSPSESTATVARKQDVRGILGGGPRSPLTQWEVFRQLEHDARPVSGGSHHASLDRLREFSKTLDLPESTLQQPLSRLRPSARYRAWAAILASLTPQFLLIDEPACALERSDHTAFGRFVRQISDDGVGILLATGDELLIARSCHRVLVLFDGSLHAEGPVEDLLPAAFATIARSRTHAPKG